MIHSVLKENLIFRHCGWKGMGKAEPNIGVLSLIVYFFDDHCLPYRILGIPFH